jgi:hypothetical protein
MSSDGSQEQTPPHDWVTFNSQVKEIEKLSKRELVQQFMIQIEFEFHETETRNQHESCD